ncbi:MAG: hypothetical protein D6E12_16400 [Desulfovibrio sp.]|nr:MAG: hypothetical protein D6E12_16400 [Desulfovibrio sp.]
MIRFLAKTIFYLALLGGIIYGGLFLFNKYLDQDLSPGAQAWLEPLQENTGTEDNGWYYVLGMTAQAGQDPFQTGMAMRRAAEQQGVEPPYFPDPSLLGESPLEFQGELPAGILADGMFNIALCRAERAAIQELAANNRELLDRFHHLAQYSSWEIGPMSSQAPGYWSTLRRVALLRLMLLALELGDPPADWATEVSGLTEVRVSRTLDELEKDLSLWRMALARGDGESDKLLPLYLGITSLAFLSDLAAEWPLTPKLSARASRLCSPLSQTERDTSRECRKAFQYRLAGIDARPSYTEVSQNGSFTDPAVVYYLLRPLYQHNHTANALYEHFSKKTLLAGDSGANMDALNQDLEHHMAGFTKWSWRSARNPYGRYMAADIAANSLSQYPKVAMLFDLKARLVALQLSMDGAPLDAEEVAQHVASSPAWLRHPVTNSPAQWAPGEQALSFLDANGEIAAKVRVRVKGASLPSHEPPVLDDPAPPGGGPGAEVDPAPAHGELPAVTQ